MKKSFLSWVGGKHLLATKIIPKIPQHRTYIEPFCGASWVLFKKDESPVEIINDINSDLVNLYRVVQLHLAEFINHLKWLLIARDEFNRFINTEPTTLTDIQRAVRFYYLIRTGYGARVKNPTFSIGAQRPSNFNLLRIEEDLSAAHLRLCRVYIENMGYEKLIPRFDTPESFFYIDPPYFGYEDYYGSNIFQKSDFESLKEILSQVSGKFMMSINDVPEIRHLFKDFVIHEVTTKYSLNLKSPKKKDGVNELLIMNYDPQSCIE
jgi:DNA adenine methylase